MVTFTLVELEVQADCRSSHLFPFEDFTLSAIVGVVLHHIILVKSTTLHLLSAELRNSDRSASVITSTGKDMEVEDVPQICVAYLKYTFNIHRRLHETVN